MNFKKSVIFILLVGIGAIYFMSNLIVDDRVEALLRQKYINSSETMKNSAKLHTAEKMDATLALAIAISHKEELIKALRENNYKLVDLKSISDMIKKHTKFKTPWFHLVSKDGVSILKSWMERKGEYILGFRRDLAKLMKEPKVTTTISVGKFNMTFKAIVPVYDGQKFIGLFEVITNFDSVAESLKNKNIDFVVLADKRYKKQLTKPYSKLFIEDYYVANSNANKEFLKLVEKIGVDNFIKNKEDYFIHKDEKHLLTNYNLLDIDGNTIGYFLLFKSLESIDTTDISNKKNLLFFILLAIFIVFFGILYYFYNRAYSNKILQLNSELEERVKKEVEENRLKDGLVLQQSKLASMGEMIGAIAHQWRQPLNALSISIQNLEYAYEDNLVDKEYLDKYTSKNLKTINFMSNTIDDFRNFFRVDKEKEGFSVKEAILGTISLQEAQLKNNGISLEVMGDDFIVNGFYNEFQQVILNIISNSKDVLLDNNIKEPEIKIILEDNKILIKDNGPGINKDIINKVFEPYFTTKDKDKGTGMGLYMSKMIIEDNMGGKLLVSNIQKSDLNDCYGVMFTIEMPTKEQREEDEKL
ncbi:hypothetical protein HUE87_10115 [Candidatus Sulfurimonas marisnigri]|uniref:histidine kinase n=1 Tax=Candidatus Sulfurimonas marisnigri TaxID=2740405 RepID=A0A7S7RQ43_9BACT|nr:ATP-binding protein [Candidatus Sulfurimonas marisnigri]QOY54224.1 hypothetical protein HUE87_10115 [Candidatus Sulfurimonas marisnigri]